MAQTLYIDIDAVNDVIRDRGAGARIEVQRSEDDTFTTPVNLANVTLSADQNTYEVFDPDGDPGDWYRHRVTASDGTVPSAWVERQAGIQTSYATVDSLRELVVAPDDSRDNLLRDLLERVTDKINLTLGFDFFRHPQISGTETRYFDGGGSSVITLQQGFLSVSSLTLASGTGATPAALTSSDYYLRSPVQDGGPYLELVLSDIAPHTYWYSGYQTVAVTGVFGYPSIPPAIEMATLYWAADLYRIGAYGGSQFGPGLGGSTGMSGGLEEFGQPRFAGGMPRITWETIEDYRRRHKTWLAV